MPATFLANSASGRIRAFTSARHFRQLRDRAWNFWLGEVERQQLDAELSAVRRGYFPVVQSLHQYQAMENAGCEHPGCYNDATTGSGIYQAICNTSRLPNPDGVRK